MYFVDVLNEFCTTGSNIYVALMSDAVLAPDTGTDLPWRPKEASEISDIHVSSFDRFTSSIHAISYPLTRLYSGKVVLVTHHVKRR